MQAVRFADRRHHCAPHLWPAHAAMLEVFSKSQVEMDIGAIVQLSTMGYGLKVNNNRFNTIFWPDKPCNTGVEFSTNMGSRDTDHLFYSACSTHIDSEFQDEGEHCLCQAFYWQEIDLCDWTTSETTYLLMWI